MKDPYERELFKYRAMLGRRAMEKFRARGEVIANLPWNRVQTVGQPPVFTLKPPENWDWNEYYRCELFGEVYIPNHK